MHIVNAQYTSVIVIMLPSSPGFLSVSLFTVSAPLSVLLSAGPEII